MTKLVSLFTALAIFLGAFSLITERKIPAASSEEQLLSQCGVIDKKELGDEVFAIGIGGYSNAEKLTAFALQGIVAKSNPCIYYPLAAADNYYLKEIEASGKNVHYMNLSFAELIQMFSSYIGDCGYVLYRESEFAEGLNVATNYATAFGWLPVQESSLELMNILGLKRMLDLSQEEYNLTFQQKHWSALRDHFRKGLVVHEKYVMTGLRDLAIEQGAYCFYTDSTDAGNRYLRKVLNWSGKNTAILGWTEMEKHFVEFVSKQGCYVIPSDLCWNNSYLSSFEADQTEQKNDDAVIYNDASKHYITLVYSDGDNCQWIQNDFTAFRKMAGDYPDTTISWTFSPFLQEFNSLALKRYSEICPEKQSLVAGPSGIGYCNLSCYDSSALDLMTTRTASAMLKSNQNVITLIDNYSLYKDAKISYRLGYFSRFDNITGGILFLDPDRYEAGGGKVWFSGDKPFVSVRLSLWAEGGAEAVTDEWIKEKSDIINSFSADISSVNGYSVVCIHAWSVSNEAIQKFIDNLDEHVVILNADDFIRTISANVPHKTATPD